MASTGLQPAKESAPTAPQPSPIPSPKVDPPVDALQLPLPPLDLHFSLAPSSAAQQLLRYARKGTAYDAKPAVVGKGGFGTVYRFERDDGFTPPVTFETGAPVSPAVGPAASHLSPEQDRNLSLPNVSPALTTVSLPADEGGIPSDVNRRYTLNRSLSNPATEPLIRPDFGARRQASTGATPQAHSDNATPRRSTPPAVIIVKVCRTPVSGAFDEMPKTGLGRQLSHAADAALLKGDTSGFHTRVVRGEARLFRFCQILSKRDNLGSAKTGLVRLLADLPFPGNEPRSDMTAAQMEEETGPVPRLLAFERLVELDAQLTSKGWQKRKREWSHREVEEVAKDVAAGLAFLHANHIVHGDLKPSNMMRDARTGAAKIIDLGASRRFVCVPNLYKDSTTAVEEFDRFLEEGTVTPQAAHMVHPEGLGSLTGSPFFMAPEVLLQAGRYVDHRHISRSVLDDYVRHKESYFTPAQIPLFDSAYSDFKRGWGIKSDIWSWSCTVLSLLLRLSPPDRRKPSDTVCAFSFNFDDLTDMTEPRHRLARSEQNLPRFHEWARRFPMVIMKTTLNGVPLPTEASGLSTACQEMMRSAFQHQDARPTANTIVKALSSGSRNLGTTNTTSNLLAALKAQRRVSLTPSLNNGTSAGDVDGNVSHAYSIHNRDVSDSRSASGAGSSGASIRSQMTMSDCSALHPCSLPSPVRRDGSIATDDGESMLWISEADVIEAPQDTDMADAKPAETQQPPAPATIPVPAPVVSHPPVAASAAAAATEQPTDYSSTKVSRRNSITAAFSKTRNAVKTLLPGHHQKSKEGLREAAIDESGAGTSTPTTSHTGVFAGVRSASQGGLSTPGSDIKHHGGGHDERRFSSLLRGSGARSQSSTNDHVVSGTASPQPGAVDSSASGSPATARTKTSILSLNGRFQHRKRGSTIVQRPPEVRVSEEVMAEGEPNTPTPATVGGAAASQSAGVGADGDTMMTDADAPAAETAVPNYPASTSSTNNRVEGNTATAAAPPSAAGKALGAVSGTTKSRKRASTIERIGMTLGNALRRD